MSFRERLQSWRYNLVPDHLVGEILTKRWTDNAIPFLALVVDVGDLRLGHSGLLQADVAAGIDPPARRILHGRHRHDGRDAGRRHRPLGRLDLRAVLLLRRLRLLHPRTVDLAGAGRLARHRPRLRRHQRLPGRLSAAARLSHHAGHLHHRPRAVRHPRHHLCRRRAALARPRRMCSDFIGDGTFWGLSVSVLAGHRPRHRHPYRADALAARLARAGGRRLAALGAQCRHPRAPHRVHDLCLLRLLRLDRRLPHRLPAERGRAGHRPQPRDHGADGGGGRRRQPRRRARLGRQGADGRHHRA